MDSDEPDADDKDDEEPDFYEEAVLPGWKDDYIYCDSGLSVVVVFLVRDSYAWEKLSEFLFIKLGLQLL